MWDLYQEKIARKDKSLRHGVGAQCRVISRFVHPSAPIWAKHINRTKDHKTELVVLIRESVKVFRRAAAAVPVFSSRVLILMMVDFTLRNDTSMWCRK